jgi:hypothetical protein
VLVKEIKRRLRRLSGFFSFYRIFIRRLGRQWGLLLWAGAALGGYGSLVALHLHSGTLRAGYTPYTIAGYLMTFIAYLAGLVWVEKRPQGAMPLIWSTAILFRLLLLFTQPTLSDDVYRYLWDGYVANNGVSPYAYPIDSPDLDYLDIPQRALANNRWMASPYLPTAQFLFQGLTFFFPLQPLFMQMAMLFFDLLAARLLAGLLRLAGQPAQRLMIYLWSPLVIVEVGHGAHLDALMNGLTLLALTLTFRPHFLRFRLLAEALAPLALALATLTKILPVFLLTVLFWRWRWWQLLGYGLVLVGLILPFGLAAGWGLTGPLDGTGLFGAIRIYTAQWNFNSGLFHWLEVVWLPFFRVEPANIWAKRLVGAGQLLLLGWVWLQARQRRADPAVVLRRLALPYMAYLLLTPTVHPWYMLSLMIFLPFLPPRPTEPAWLWLKLAPWLYLSGALVLSYLTYLDPLNFAEIEWVRHAEWLPTLGLLGLAWGWSPACLLVKEINRRLRRFFLS